MVTGGRQVEEIVADLHFSSLGACYTQLGLPQLLLLHAEVSVDPLHLVPQAEVGLPGGVQLPPDLLHLGLKPGEFISYLIAVFACGLRLPVGSRGGLVGGPLVLPGGALVAPGHLQLLLQPGVLPQHQQQLGLLLPLPRVLLQVLLAQVRLELHAGLGILELAPEVFILLLELPQEVVSAGILIEQALEYFFILNLLVLAIFIYLVL